MPARRGRRAVGTLVVAASDPSAAEALLAQISGYVALARNGGPAGLWDGPGGITSSVAAGSMMSLGMGMEGSNVLVKYTRTGDIDLNGRR